MGHSVIPSAAAISYVIFLPQAGRCDVFNQSVEFFGPLEGSEDEFFGHCLCVLSEVFEQTADALKVLCHSEDIGQSSEVTSKDDSIRVRESQVARLRRMGRIGKIVFWFGHPIPGIQPCHARN